MNPYFIKKGDGEPRTYFPVPEENQKEVDLDPWPGAEEVGTEKTCFIRQRSKIGESWSSPILYIKRVVTSQDKSIFLSIILKARDSSKNQQNFIIIGQVRFGLL
jgi:hypothetical protein